ncbi:hypothetical protein A0H76_1793 [Hepatospora eriocheir]|uniref:Uncharacterized protein n=1 Tax=Hepatospora eriocheir TaxID=1081669 RepID=A0A1X0QKG6_9MICR|nr:hypothetical protein A0H76_1793 [Hepatospora eriocheir]
MIIEILDFCVNVLNGSFYETKTLLSIQVPFFKKVSSVLCLYLAFFGIYTHRLSFIYLENLIFFNIFFSLNEKITDQINSYINNKPVQWIFNMIFHPVLFVFLLATIKYQTYNYIMYPVVALAGRFFFALTSNFYKKIITTDEKRHILTFLTSQFISFLFKRLNSKYEREIVCFWFSFGGIFYCLEFIKNMDFVKNYFNFKVCYDVSIKGNDFLLTYATFVCFLGFSYTFQMVFYKIYVKKKINKQI